MLAKFKKGFIQGIKVQNGEANVESIEFMSKEEKLRQEKMMAKFKQ